MEGERRVERINGIKFNIERLSDDELTAMHGYTTERAMQVYDELTVLETEMLERGLPLDTDEENLQTDRERDI